MFLIQARIRSLVTTAGSEVEQSNSGQSALSPPSCPFNPIHCPSPRLLITVNTHQLDRLEQARKTPFLISAGRSHFHFSFCCVSNPLSEIKARKTPFFNTTFFTLACVHFSNCFVSLSIPIQTISFITSISLKKLYCTLPQVNCIHFLQPTATNKYPSSLPSPTFSIASCSPLSLIF